MAPLTPPGDFNLRKALPSLAAGTLAAVLFAALLAGGLLSISNWVPAGTPLVLPTFLGALCVLLATLAGLALFAVTATRTPAAAPVALLASSTLRLLLSLSLALVVYFLFVKQAESENTSQGRVFWAVFLFCGLAAIVAEAAWGARNLNRPTVTTQNSPVTTPAPAVENH